VTDQAPPDALVTGSDADTARAATGDRDGTLTVPAQARADVLVLGP
jgi:hypothetical protein